MYQDEFMQRAIALSSHSLQVDGTQPFGAVVVQDGKIVGEGFNHAVSKCDPTSHGEIEAIRDACKRLQTLDLTGCELYTSCEPCSVCVATMYGVGITKIYYAADLKSSTEAFLPLSDTVYKNIDTDWVRTEVGLPIEQRSMPCSQHHAEKATEVIKQWAQAKSKELK